MRYHIPIPSKPNSTAKIRITRLSLFDPTDMSVTGKVAKKRGLYPPKRVMDKLGLKEGQLVRYTVQERKLIVEPVRDPIDLALASKKWGEDHREKIRARVGKGAKGIV